MLGARRELSDIISRRLALCEIRKVWYGYGSKSSGSGELGPKLERVL